MLVYPKEDFARRNMIDEERVGIRDHGVNLAALLRIRQGRDECRVGFAHIHRAPQQKVCAFPDSQIDEIDGLARRGRKRFRQGIHGIRKISRCPVSFQLDDVLVDNQ